MKKKVDAAIIGAGTAGINALSEIRKVTDDVVLINDGPLGTTCARVGCMPSKMMIHVGDLYHRRQDFADYGIKQGADLSIDMATCMARVRAMRDGFVNGIIADVIEPLGERFIEGRAEFVEPTLLKVGSITVQADSIVIATGSKPLVPREWSHLSEYLLTTDTFFEQNDFPQDLAVIGLGAIGLELGQALTRMGHAVTGFDQIEQIGGLRDPHVSRTAVALVEKEMPLKLGSDTRIDEEDGRLRITAGNRRVTVDKVLLSVGRVPNLDDLHVDRLGAALDDHGVPYFDHHTMQIGDLPVFIAGDVGNYRPILHEVAHEGSVAGYNAVHRPIRGFKRKTPLTICFTDPNICLVGASWDKVKTSNPAVGRTTFQGGREKIMQRPHGTLHIYADRDTGLLLGAEMVAPQGEHLAHLLAWSIQQSMTVHDLLAMPFYHPTVEETLRTALSDLLDQVNAVQSPLTGFEVL